MQKLDYPNGKALNQSLISMTHSQGNKVIKKTTDDAEDQTTASSSHNKNMEKKVKMNNSMSKKLNISFTRSQKQKNTSKNTNTKQFIIDDCEALEENAKIDKSDNNGKNSSRKIERADGQTSVEVEEMEEISSPNLSCINQIEMTQKCSESTIPSYGLGIGVDSKFGEEDSRKNGSETNKCVGTLKSLKESIAISSNSIRNLNGVTGSVSMKKTTSLQIDKYEGLKFPQSRVNVDDGNVKEQRKDFGCRKDESYNQEEEIAQNHQHFDNAKVNGNKHCPNTENNVKTDFSLEIDQVTLENNQTLMKQVNPSNQKSNIQGEHQLTNQNQSNETSLQFPLAEGGNSSNNTEPNNPNQRNENQKNKSKINSKSHSKSKENTDTYQHFTNLCSPI